MSSVAERVRMRRDELSASLTTLEQTLTQVNSDAKWVQRLNPILLAEAARLRQQLADQDGDPERTWEQLVGLSEKVERLAGEALQFVGGMGARTSGIDGGACDLADGLIAEVSPQLLTPYQPITLPSAGEYINVLSEVIRVRYPGQGVWDVPIVLHEFGHYLVARLRITRGGPGPATIIEEQRAEKPYLGYFAEELWADAFATYVGGPAYAASAITRFDPATASRDRKPTHPAPAKRAMAMFLALERLQAAWIQSRKAAGTLKPMIEAVRESWHEACAPFCGDGKADDGDSALAPLLAEKYLEILDREVVKTRFGNGKKAAQIRRSIVEGEARPTGISLVDALNGGWWARLEAEADGRYDKIPAIAAATEELCATILSGGGIGG